MIRLNIITKKDYVIMRRLLGLTAAVTLLLFVAVLIASCGGGRGMSTGILLGLGTDQPQTGGEEAAPPADEQSPEADEPTGGNESVTPPADAPPWTGNEEGVWRDPNTGELIPIVEGFAKLEMKLAVSGDEELAFWETIEARGYVPVGAFLFLPPYDGRGIMHGLQLPPGVTFAEAYESLMAEFGDLIAFLDPWTLDDVDYLT